RCKVRRRRNSNTAKKEKDPPASSKMAELFDNKIRYVSDFEATVPDYRRKVEVIFNPDTQSEDIGAEVELEDSLRRRDGDETEEKIVDYDERNMDVSEEEEEEVYTIRPRPPLDQLARNWVVYEAFPCQEIVHHCYSMASVVIEKP
ncbi:hypothetical protein PFISCL1PPCAC_3336, partial [Pristionchus fissidentatus]